MISGPTLRLGNGQPIARSDLPRVSVAEFREQVVLSVEHGARLDALFGIPLSDKVLQIVAVLADAESGEFALTSTGVRDNYPAITPDCVQAHWFEREIAEQWAVTPKGHPWHKPIRFHRAYRPGRDAWGRDALAPIVPGVTDFFRVEGEEIHEVAVGPVHAGVIEPGHFRFQCHGERVLHLEVALGYQHRGIERALVTQPHPRILPYVETLAGDTTIGHTTAYCQAVEALADCTVPARADVIRGLALELERLANHVGDLGALAGDVGYLPTLSFCGRLRGEFLNMSALICGSRFGRSLVRPGGVSFDIEPSRAEELLARLTKVMRDVKGAVNLLWETPSVLARFEDTGFVSQKMAAELGLVGPAARASGLERDARFDFSTGIFRMAQIPVSTWQSGDVFARAWVRWLEIQRSAAFIGEQLRALPDGPLRSAYANLAPERLVVSMVEGWRGEICHVAITDGIGRLAHYKIVDPSFHNWMGLAMAMRNQEISDFPLCNKSFNLSYCGHDL
ncbi:MAG: hydrogenase [Deltaproteobacteria bacterium RIFOXYA12_FULL_58_15]|nr:MAG: hydrogenase [Deltaproteobacteria bacterium RIFOXYA12_FULL_58_15]OGR10176.1 MAG: hydrogenase [Deltaproteobacteria bacterium RIFOXYB12_FULL_58_9]